MNSGPNAVGLKRPNAPRGITTFLALALSIPAYYLWPPLGFALAILYSLWISAWGLALIIEQTFYYGGKRSSRQ